MTHERLEPTEQEAIEDAMSSRDDLYERLQTFYRSQGILDTPLQNTCKHCASCWKGIEARKWDSASEAARIYLPYIGEKYEEARILCLGINMNEFGGLWAESNLAAMARQRIIEGKRRIRFDNPNYAGTFFWHRVPVYVSIELIRLGIQSESLTQEDFPSKENIAGSFDYFAISNSVKCSPIGEKSVPTESMFSNCTTHILKDEIRILKPRVILVLGNSANRGALKNAIEGEIAWEQFKNIFLGKVFSPEGIVEVICMPHPTSFSGNSADLAKRLRETRNLTASSSKENRSDVQG